MQHLTKLGFSPFDETENHIIYVKASPQHRKLYVEIHRLNTGNGNSGNVQVLFDPVSNGNSETSNKDELTPQDRQAHSLFRYILEGLGYTFIDTSLDTTRGCGDTRESDEDHGKPERRLREGLLLTRIDRGRIGYNPLTTLKQDINFLTNVFDWIGQFKADTYMKIELLLGKNRPPQYLRHPKAYFCNP